MTSEDEIADVYEEFLNNESDMYLIEQLRKVVKSKKESDEAYDLESYEHEHLVRFILNVDWTGKYDIGFEDQRRDLVDGDNYRCEGQ